PAAPFDTQRSLSHASSNTVVTLEPLSLYAYCSSLRPDGRSSAATTDPASGLEQLARERGFRRVFAGDPHIGGRYSALSAFGIVPGALIGVDVAALLNGAAAAWHTRAPGDAQGTRCDGAGAEGSSAGIWLGAALSALARSG